MTLLKLSPNTIIAKRPDLLASQVDDEMVMLDMESGNYFGLDSIAADIWNLLEQPISITALCQRLEQEYQVDHQQCLADTTEFLEQLLANNMIEVHEQAA